MDISGILKQHNEWLEGRDGVCANLCALNLSNASLIGVNLRSASMQGINLSNADLYKADLGNANMRNANLSGADLSEANLYGVELSAAKLCGANLEMANLRYADLTGADLSGADLTDAELDCAKLGGANLSGVKGLLSPMEWMKQFEHDEYGWIVYKRIGKTCYEMPSHWIIEPGEYLTEVVNPDPCVACGSGVNFATRDWCNTVFSDAALWRCRIWWKWGPSIVVPYHTDGKARCGKLELIEVVKES